MDDSPIQTALCVIGHPIGGNPTQFVAQRALAALGLDWQFMSFEVAPAQIEEAIRGVDSLGFCGAMIASPYQNQVAGILSSSRDESIAGANEAPIVDVHSLTWHDCLYRDQENLLLTSNVYAEALKRIIDSHAKTTGSNIQRCLLIGDEVILAQAIEPFLLILPDCRLVVTGAKLASWPVVISSPSHSTGESSTETPATESTHTEEIESSPSLVIWSVTGKPSKKPPAKSLPNALSSPFVADLLLRLHPGSLLIDLSGNANVWLSTRKAQDTTSPDTASIAVVNNTELEVNRLAIAIQRWTGHEPSIDAMREAIEEYLEI